MTNIAIAVDQLLNAVLFGSPDETLSARMWRNRARPGWSQARAVVDKIFFWQEAHCQKSYESEMQRKQLPAEYRRCE